jgi:hypothetical protein
MAEPDLDGKVPEATVLRDKSRPPLLPAIGSVADGMSRSAVWYVIEGRVPYVERLSSIKAVTPEEGRLCGDNGMAASTGTS